MITPVKKPDNYIFQQYRVVGDKLVEYKRFIAYRFEVSAELMAGHVGPRDKFYDWFESPKGKWLAENTVELHYDSYNRVETWTTEYVIIATVEAKKLTEYYLRFS